MSTEKILLLTLLSLVLLWTCNESKDQDTNKPQFEVDSFESAVPHGSPLPETKLSEYEKTTLRLAKGREAELIDKEALREIIDQDSSGLVIYNLWSPKCERCKVTSLNLRELRQDIIGPEKFNIVHLVPQLEEMNLINGAIREWNLVDPVYCIKLDSLPRDYTVIDNNWNGNFPAILLINQNEGLRLFYQKTFSINELEALLLPLTF